MKRHKTCISELVADPDSIPVFDEDSRLSLAIWEETEQNQKIRDAVDALSRVLRDSLLRFMEISEDQIKAIIIRRYGLSDTYAQNFLDDDSKPEESTPEAV